MESCFTVEKWISLNSNSSGKDKIARLLQYLSRFIWYYSEKRQNFNALVSQLKVLEKALSSFRKLLRFGKSFEILHGALKTIHLRDNFLRILITLSRIYQSLFLLCDHCMWLLDNGFLRMNKANLHTRLNRFWLGSIILGLLRDAYEVYSVLVMKTYRVQNYPKQVTSKSFCSKISYSSHFYCRSAYLFALEHEDIFWDTVKNICDIWIPLTNLGHVKLSPGLVGLLGAVSSFAGLVPIVKPVSKLVPN